MLEDSRVARLDEVMKLLPKAYRAGDFASVMEARDEFNDWRRARGLGRIGSSTLETWIKGTRQARDRDLLLLWMFLNDRLGELGKKPMVPDLQLARRQSDRRLKVVEGGKKREVRKTRGTGRSQSTNVTADLPFRVLIAA